MGSLGATLNLPYSKIHLSKRFWRTLKAALSQPTWQVNIPLLRDRKHLKKRDSTEECVTHVTYFIPNEKDFICNVFTITNCLSSKKSFRVV